MTCMMLASAPVTAGELEIPADLVKVGAVVCLKVDNRGAVSGAYVIESTAGHEKDKEIVAGVKQLTWGKAKSGDRSRNIWFPMSIAFGEVVAPIAPASCAPAKGVSQPRRP